METDSDSSHIGANVHHYYVSLSIADELKDTRVCEQLARNQFKIVEGFHSDNIESLVSESARQKYGEASEQNSSSKHHSEPISLLTALPLNSICAVLSEQITGESKDTSE